MYQALYRKWRPRTFDDVVGQESITTTLKNEVSHGTPAHAYLFCGSRGTGKTTCSRILAMAVNCRDQKDGNPCGACDMCRAIEEGTALDITEIDAASNSGVDNIRELREEANFMPAMADYRVYIIDETHMLSTGAFNALLKIMEEPPPHVMFILATTELHKVPATILSRCQRFDFRRIPSGIIRDRLLYVAGEEGISLNPDAAELIARLSDGGMRDALSLLDICVSSDSHVTADSVKKCAGLVGRNHLFSMARAIHAKDSGQALSLLASLWEQSVEPQRLCEQLIGFHRDLMVAKAVKEPDGLIACLPEELEEIRGLAAAMDMPGILRCMEVFQDALARMSRSAMRRAELEMALLRLCQADQKASVSSDLAGRVEKLEQAVRRGPVAQPDASGKAKKTETPAASREEIEKTKVEPFEQWPQVLEALKRKNLALHGALIDSKAYVGGDLLLVDAGELFAKMVRSDDYARASLREAAQEATGNKYRLGPYSAEKYTVREASGGLDDLIARADELGVDIQVSQ